VGSGWNDAPADAPKRIAPFYKLVKALMAFPGCPSGVTLPESL